MFSTLIVDDNHAFRQSLHQVLSRRFPAMRIAEVVDGESALYQAAYQHPDLIFMDIRLPGRNGLEITKAIKSADYRPIICILTSHDLPEYRDAAMRNGADHFLVKGESSEAQIAALVDDILSVGQHA